MNDLLLAAKDGSVAPIPNPTYLNASQRIGRWTRQFISGDLTITIPHLDTFDQLLEITGDQTSPEQDYILEHLDVTTDTIYTAIENGALQLPAAPYAGQASTITGLMFRGAGLTSETGEITFNNWNSTPNLTNVFGDAKAWAFYTANRINDRRLGSHDVLDLFDLGIPNIFSDNSAPFGLTENAFDRMHSELVRLIYFAGGVTIPTNNQPWLTIWRMY